MVKTRFAPSPTGYLHIGGLRTALFAYLIAKSQGGELILRIEDTDQKREVPGAVEKLKAALDWAGIKFDGGEGFSRDGVPYTQSKRTEIYRRYRDRLLAAGRAYPCFCPPERLKSMREQQQANKQAPRYDRLCRELDADAAEARIKAGEPFVVRQKMPLSGEVKVYDEIRGEIVFKAADLEDQVLIKSDGWPTYQFAVVVDDHLMDISHVVRGEEWIPSFPKNILLYQAFGWTAPKFVHLPLVMKKGGGKLSKREGDASVEDFKAKGYLPTALLNFVALLGWSPYARPDKDQGKKNPEILSLAELVSRFDLKNLNASPAVFDNEKLDYLNGYYIRQADLAELSNLCRPYLEEYWLKSDKKNHFKTAPANYTAKVVALEQERMKRLDEIGDLTEFFFLKELDYPQERLVWKKMPPERLAPNLNKIIEILEKIPENNWTKASLEEGIMSYLKAKELPTGEYLWPLRVALTGRAASPGPFEIAAVLGKNASLERLETARKK